MRLVQLTCGSTSDTESEYIRLFMSGVREDLPLVSSLSDIWNDKFQRLLLYQSDV